jgi:hypothetical protein
MSRATAPEKKGSRHNPQHTGWLIHRYIPNFSPKTAIEVVGAKPIFCWWLATRFSGPISPAGNWYVQYMLAGANPSVLHQHRWGYHHLRSLPSLRSSNLTIALGKKVIWSTYRRPVVFWPLCVYRSLYLRLGMTIFLQILARSLRIIRKVFIMQLWFQSTPINLIHNHS